MSSFYLGKRLSVKGERCTVRYVGEVKDKKGEWLGVEWDDPTRGKHSGSHDGIEYFKCRSPHPTAGSFLRPSATFDQPKTFLEALRSKYVAIEAESGDISKPQNVIRISGKEAEEVGFDKIARQQAQLENLRIAVLDDLLIHVLANSDLDAGDLLEQIPDTCPNVTDLDLGRNLFETLTEISAICDQLPKLRSLNLNGNRLRDVSLAAEYSRAARLSALVSASLDHMLLSGDELESILQRMINIKDLSASGNRLKTLDDIDFPISISSITLEDNDFSSIEDVMRLGISCTQLYMLNLKNNRIRTTLRKHDTKTRSDRLSFPDCLTDLDLSYNDITSWELIDELAMTFPGLKHLRISQNPLFSTLRAADGRPLSSADGYMLTIARLPKLETLNYSKITDKERLNSETYYLSQIAAETSLASPDREADIISRHPRYYELCEEYGKPHVERKSATEVDPNSLAARLVKCIVYSREAKDNLQLPTHEDPHTIDIPKSFSIYSVLGLIGRKVQVQPLRLKLVLETGERDRIGSSTNSWQGVHEWDSDEDEPDEVGEEWQEREIELVAGTRSLGTFVEKPEARIRIELRP